MPFGGRREAAWRDRVRRIRESDGDLQFAYSSDPTALVGLLRRPSRRILRAPSVSLCLCGYLIFVAFVLIAP